MTIYMHGAVNYLKTKARVSNMHIGSYVTKLTKTV